VQAVPCIRLAKIVNMAASLEKTVEEHELHEEDEQDEEKAFLAHELAEHKAYPQKIIPSGLSRKFWVFAAINTSSTAGIVSLLVAHSCHLSTKLTTTRSSSTSDYSNTNVSAILKSPSPPSTSQ
jgi:hypothetical protein